MIRTAWSMRCRWWFGNLRMILAVGREGLELGPWRPWPSDHRDQFALRVAVAVDVPLGGLDRPMACQQLDVPQAAACLVDDAGGAGDEGPAA